MKLLETKLDAKNIEDIFALTPMQEGMLFHYLKDSSSDLYFEQVSLEISGEIDIHLLERAWNFIIGTNEMLRTVFRWENVQNPVQIVLKTNHLQIRFFDIDIYDKDIEQKTKRLKKIKIEDKGEKFDLRYPPFRVTVCKFEPYKYIMIISHHHIIYDGWSTGIILKEFFHIYNDLVNGNCVSKKPVKAKFKEFVKWESNQDTGKQKEFLEKYLKGFKTKLHPPLKTGKRKNLIHKESYKIKLPHDMKSKLENFARRHYLTIASLLYSSWGILLQKLHSGSDVIFDTTVSGRSQMAKEKNMEDVVGLFINTLPLGVQGQCGDKISGLLSRMSDVLQRWEEFENISQVIIKECLETRGKGTLFDSVMILETYPLETQWFKTGGALSVRSFSHSGITNYDMTIIITIFDNIEINFIYNKDLFNKKITAALCRCFIAVLEEMSTHPDKNVSRLDVWSDEELFNIFNHLKEYGEKSEPGVLDEYIPPGDELEETLTRIWSEVLDIKKEKISTNANFFDFGGHSLKASLLVSQLNLELKLKIPLSEVFGRPTIKQLSEFIKDSAETVQDACTLFEAAEEKEYYALSSAQQRFFMIQQVDLKSTAYNAHFFMEMRGKLDRERLEVSFSRLVNRHGSLRTAFIYHNGKPVQKIHQEIDFTITYVKTSEETAKKMVSRFIVPFNLSRAPLIRVKLIHVDNSNGNNNAKYILLVDTHHIISDGTSVSILIKEFTQLYAGNELPVQRFRYKDFSEWQNLSLRSGKLRQQEEFWLKRFSGKLPVLNMPLDYPRPPVRHFEGDRIVFHLEEELALALNQLGKETGATLYMVLLAVFTILLNKYTSQHDIIIGTPTAGRNHRDLQNIFGLFLEMIAVRTFPRNSQTFMDYLQEVKDITIEAYENQVYPLGELIKHVLAKDDFSRAPLFDVMLIVQNHGLSKLEMDYLKIKPLWFERNISKLDITLEAHQYEKGKGIVLELEYCTKLFKRSTMERFIRHFAGIVGEVVASPGRVLASIDMMTHEERKQILETFNNTYVEYNTHKLLHELFEEQVEKTPDNIAIVGMTYNPAVRWQGAEKDSNPGFIASISYRELNRRSNRLAYVLKEKGINPDVIVGIMVERSLEMIIGIMAILKAGGAYLPIEPDYPAERIRFMLTDSRAKVLVTTSSLAKGDKKLRSLEVKRGIETTFIDFLEFSNFSSSHLLNFLTFRPSNLAYVIYTSGSTGKPKGVMVRHKNITAYLHAFAKEFEITAEDTVIQQASFSFDVFLEEVFPCLSKGGRLSLPYRDEVKNTALLCHFISRHKVTIIDCSPLLLNELNKCIQRETPKLLRSIRIFISGGDVLKKEYIDRLIKIGTVYNTYGPTETTVCATYYKLTGANETGIPIGRPISNYRVYILGQGDRLLPVGVPGELCIAGKGTNCSYLNRPGLTSEKFVEIPWGSGDIMYRTGDLGRWQPDGCIEFLGRMDRQVNIKGYRIELGEIESCLASHEKIRTAAVVAGNHSLCAYFIAPVQIAIREVRKFLATKLPAYMIPAYFVQMDRFPLTASGKIDVGGLPEPHESMPAVGVEYVKPTGEIEGKLAAIWKSLLGWEKIGKKDNFFELGGDSIRMIQCMVRIREELHREISLKTFFQHSTLEELAGVIEAGGRQKEELPPIKRISRDRPIPLSFSQEQIWIMQQLYDGYMSYHVPRAIRIIGNLDTGLLEQTFTEIIRRHEILRTVFPAVDHQPVQKINEPYPFKIPVSDMCDLEGETQKQEVSAFIVEEGQRGFDLEQGPMLRVTLLKLNAAEHMLVLVEHHLVHDGWTQGVMLREFTEIYRAFSRGNPSPLPELPIQYADFAYWQRQHMQGKTLERHLDYLKFKLSGLPLLLELPADRPRPPVISGRGGMIQLTLAKELYVNLVKLSNRHDVTLFMTMLAVFKMLLYRYTGVQDLCVGTGTANRLSKELEGMMGMVINTIALRTRVQGELSFEALLKRVKYTCWEAYEHENTPFEKVVEALRPERSLSYTPIFQVLFGFMDTPTQGLVLPNLEFSIENSHNRSSKFDLNVLMVMPMDSSREVEEDIFLEWEYNTDIFDERTVHRMALHYRKLLQQVITHMKSLINTFDLLTSDEKDRLLYEWNHTRLEYQEGKLINQLFENMSEKEPDSIAVVGLEPVAAVTYRELNRISAQLVHSLRKRGVKPGSIVGIIMEERSIEMVMAILGVLKAGGAYLPIDPNYPAERIVYMLADSNTNVLVTAESPAEDGKVRILNLSRDPGEITGANAQPGASLAYVIYTSGSTGRPKGVMVQHKNVVRLVKNTNYLDFEKKDRILMTGALEFDASTFEIWGALLNGWILYLPDKQTILVPERLKDTIKTHDIGTLWLTSPLFNWLSRADADIFRGLRNLLVGGDVLAPIHINRVRHRLPRLRIINGYGPTENTTFSTTCLVDKDYEPSIPIGKPIANSTAYIVYGKGCLQPVGITGELWLGGDGVSRGYMNNPELTAEKFINEESIHPSPITRHPSPIYKTGDLARWLPDGNIEFIGRIDYQVKIRGYRVEPGEIETCLLKHPQIEEAVVIVKEHRGIGYLPHHDSGDKDLCAYIVPGGNVSAAVLRNYLTDYLPAYMQPAYFVLLDQIPLNPNGKIDYSRLPLPEMGEAEQKEDFIPPRDELDKKLVEIWSLVLAIQKDKISMDSDFFQLGGNSLKAAALISRLHQELHVKVPLSQVFTTPHVFGLADYIKGAEEDGFTSLEPVEKKEYYVMTSAQKRLYLLQQVEPDSTAYNIPLIIDAEEIPFQGEENGKLSEIFRQLIERHESLRTSFRLVNGEPVQQVHDNVNFEVEYYEVTQRAEVEHIIKCFIRPFDLSQSPFFRVGLVKWRSKSGVPLVLITDMHHIITDGVSCEILIRDFNALYAGEDKFPPLKLQYKDYAVWENRQERREAVRLQQVYWLEQFNDGIPLFSLPLDYPRPTVPSFAGSAEIFTLGKRETTEIKKIAGDEGATTFMVVLALCNIMLTKLSAREDIVIGTPTIRRPHVDLEQIIGVFLNTLSLRNFPEGGKTFTGFLKEVKMRTLKAFENQDYPFDELVDDLLTGRVPGRHPIFDVMLAAYTINRHSTSSDQTIEEKSLAGLKTGKNNRKPNTSKFDLAIICMDNEGEMSFTFQYSSTLFKQETIQRFTRYFKEIIAEVIENPSILLGDIIIDSRLEDAEEVMNYDDFAF